MAYLNYVCSRCCGEAHPIDGRYITEVDVDGTLQEIVASLSYLGDTLCADSG